MAVYTHSGKLYSTSVREIHEFPREEFYKDDHLHGVVTSETVLTTLSCWQHDVPQ